MIKIQQTLHGYSQGHHLLAGTALLKTSEDMLLMSQMSDWAGFESKYDKEVSYLTAYPLSAEYYVVAKTWYAYEMSRPGCVWTHSLLIRFDDLNRIPDFKALQKIFRRPIKDEDFAEYGRVIEIDEGEPKDGVKEVSLTEANISMVYVTLLQLKKPLVYQVKRNNDDYQDIILHLMDYIPGGVLSKYTFSSGSTVQRQFRGNSFDLQFVINSPEGFDNLAEEKKWAEVSVMSYVDYSIRHGRYELRSLLQMFAEDVGDSEVRWVNVITLFVHLHVFSQANDQQKPSLYISLLKEIGEAFPTKAEGEIVKSRFAMPEISKRMIDNYQFLLESATNEIFHSFTVGQIQLVERIKELLKRENDNQFFDLISDIYKKGLKTEIGLSLFLAASKTMDDANFKRLLEKDYTLIVSLLPYNDQIINNKVWIDAPKDTFEHIFTLFSVKSPEPFDYWPELFEAIIRNETLVLDGMLQRMWQHVDHPLAKLLDILNQGDKHRFVSPAIIDECGKYKKEMLKWLKEHQIENEDVARLYMKHFKAESQEVQCSQSEDWKHFDMKKGNRGNDYYAYLYNLSFNWVESDLAFQYFKHAFYPLYVSAQKSKLQERYWAQIEHNTVSRWIADWDRCKKMRLMAARRILQAKLDETVIAEFTPDYGLNQEILKYYIRMKGKK